MFLIFQLHTFITQCFHQDPDPFTIPSYPVAVELKNPKFPHYRQFVRYSLD